MATTKTTRPPAGLGSHGRGLWRRIVRDYQLSDSEAVLLEAMAASYDRFREARVLVASEGITVAGRFGPKVHPAVAVERDAATQLRHLARQLDLALPDDVPVRLERPGPTGETRRRRNTQLQARRRERWAREVAG